jgi:hypothetical protein
VSGDINRHHEVGIRIGADDWKSVCNALRHLLWTFEREGPGHNLTSGSPDYGIIAIDETHDQVTHNSYFAEIDRWLEERKNPAAEHPLHPTDETGG